MNIEYTFSMLKPDATSRNITGSINKLLEEEGFKIVAQKMTTLTSAQAEKFYEEHKNRPFFKDLVSYITSGPVILQVLKRENAVLKNREVMGATDPKEAKVGTIRNKFGKSIEENTIHGSDSLDSANREISFFFAKKEILD